MEVVIHKITEYSVDVTEQLGLLRPDLSEGKSANPVDPEVLMQIIESDSHAQYVASLRGRIVGAATMSLTMGGIVAGRKSWLEDFVVASSEDIRGQGVGHKLFWEGPVDWSHQMHARKMDFHSNETRDQAHKFYKRQGCIISPTSPFELVLV